MSGVPGESLQPTAPSQAKRGSLAFLVAVLREYTALYGPLVLLLEDLHHHDTWSWQLLLKVWQDMLRVAWQVYVLLCVRAAGTVGRDCDVLQHP